MHKLLADHPDQKMLLLGNEAIARGAIEAVEWWAVPTLL